jgi:transposase-like protein
VCCARLLGQHVTSTSGSSSPGAPADGHTSTLRKACSSCGLTTAQACRELSRRARQQGVCAGVQRFMVVDNLDFSPTRLTAFSVRRILAFRGALPSPHFSTTRILMALHVFVFVFLLVVCLLFSLALLWRLDRFHLRPFFSRGEAKRSSLPRLLKPRTPDDCPACRLASTASSAGEPAPVRPWCEVKSRRGAPKRIPTEGFACPNKQCRYFGNTDAHRHALVGDGKHGKAEPIQTFRCQACHTTFTSRRNTPLYRLKTPSSHVAMVLSALAEGLDPSAAERVFGIRQATMTTWLTRSGEHAQTLHEHVFCHLHLPYLQLDELRTRLRSPCRDPFPARALGCLSAFHSLPVMGSTSTSMH